MNAPRRPARTAPRPGRRWVACWAASTLVLCCGTPLWAGEQHFLAELAARSFFAALLEGRPAAALPLCGPTVSFEGERVQGKEALARRLERLSQRAREKGLVLRRITVLSGAEALSRLGPPPARLGNLVRPARRVALVRFNHLGAVAVLERQGGLWRVVGLTD